MNEPSDVGVSTVDCAGVSLLATDLSGAVDVLFQAAEAARGTAMHFCNAYTLSLADRDTEYRELLCGSDLRLPDGQAVVWASRLTNRREGQLTKVSGPDFFEAAFAASDSQGPRHFLLGGSPETLAALKRGLESRHPEAQIVGTDSPPFRPLTHDELAAQDQRIKESRADIVWVGLGTPKQDVEAVRLARAVDVTAVAVGAAFDFSAGTKKRAPAWVSRAGLEWLHRLASEPRRLWRRYLVGNAVFIAAVWRRRP